MKHSKVDRYALQRRIGFHWLRFTRELEEEFRQAFLPDDALRVRISHTVGIVGVLGFILLDYFFAERLQPAMAILVLLLITVPALATPIVLSFRGQQGHPWFTMVMFLCALIMGLSLVWVVHLGRAANAWFPYESLLLVTMYLYFLSGLFYFQAAVAGTAVWAGFVISQALLDDPRHSLAYEAYYLLLANVIGMLGLYVLELRTRRYFLQESELREQAGRDALTGLMNRRAFRAHFERVWMQAYREKTTIGLMLVDIDNFKNINDTCGHEIGDDALVSVARALREFAQRPLDAVSRYGGDELIVAWYGMERAQLEHVATELPRRLKSIHYGEHKQIGLQVSGGAVLAIPALGVKPGEVIRIADEKLYEMKRSGRGTISFAVLNDAIS